jgi:hypothetical protein
MGCAARYFDEAHVTTKEEMMERHHLVKKTTPCATPTEMLPVWGKWTQRPVLPVKRKNTLGDFHSKTDVMTTPDHTTKRVTLRRRHEFLSSWKQNCSTLQRQAGFLKLAKLVFEYSFLNLKSFSRGVTSGSDSFHRGLWSDVFPSSHPSWWNQIKRVSWLRIFFSINKNLII